MKTRVIGLALGLAGCNEGIEFRSNSLDSIRSPVLFDEEFPAASIKSRSLTYQPLYGLVSEDLVLREKPPLTHTVKQLDRALNQESYTQGHDGDTTTQEFDVSTAGKLDLLMVIDNSGSMGPKQAALAPNLRSLLKNLDTVDWQIGVITTDSCTLRNAARAGTALRKGDANIETTFGNTISGVGTTGSRDEQGIKTAMQQLSGICPGSPNSWLRSDAALAVFFLSDEQNECFGDPNCADDNGIKWGSDQLISLMNRMRSPDKLKAYALLWNKNSNDKPSRNPLCNRESGVETYGSMYANVVDAFGGVEGSLCLDNDSNTNDYAPVLEKISGDVNRIVQREFTLSQEPVPGSLDITVDGIPAEDVQIVGRKVILKNASNTQMKLKITYRYDAVPQFDRVSLKTRPATDTIDIKVANKPLEKSEYLYDDNSGQLIFLNPPKQKEKISIRYRSQGSLPSKFDVKNQVTAEGPILSASINGKIVQDWRLEENGTKVVFGEAPTDGAQVTFSYRPKEPKITSYTLNSNENRNLAKNILAKDKVTGEIVPFQTINDQIEFDPDEVVEGREIAIIYNYGDTSDILDHQLSHVPLQGSLEISSLSSSGDCIENVKIEGRNVTFQCDQESLDEVTISYKYLEEKFSTFKINTPIQDVDFVKVFIDGQETSGFTRKGQIITIPPNLLTIYSKIRVIALANTLSQT